MTSKGLEFAEWLLSMATKNGDCLECHYSDVSNGYCKVSSDETAHRFIYRISVGPIPKGMCICHKCDNRRCINKDHLFLGTAADNVADMMAKGRLSGQGRPRELTQQHIVKIIHLREEEGMSFRQIGEVIGVSWGSARLYYLRGKADAKASTRRANAEDNAESFRRRC